MAIDTPATIGVIGAGPIGLEAALYARFLGYRVLIFDKGGVADHVNQWGHVRMFSPFSMNRSSLGLAALEAQGDGFTPPSDDALLTGNEWRERYLKPLAATDLLSDGLRLNCLVCSISRTDYLKTEAVGDPVRGEDEFRILFEDADGQEQEELVDAVIDASGVFSQPNWLGLGGGPALGERRLGDRIVRGLPDVLGEQRSQFSNRTTMVVGGGYSAATTVVALGNLRQEAPETEIYWVIRNATAALKRIPDDRLRERDALAKAAIEMVEQGRVQCIQGVGVVAVDDNADDRQQLSVKLSDGSAKSVDHLVSHTGFHVDSAMFRELQVHQCYASEGPMQFAASLMAGDSGTGDCLDQAAPAASVLCTTEPNFYILGAKSYGRNSQFLMQLGLVQIRQLFALIGDRDSLNLYATIALPNADS